MTNDYDYGDFILKLLYFLNTIINFFKNNFIDNYSTRTFNQDYPNSSHIIATYKSGSTSFVSWYNIISLGCYPKNVIMTQKNSKDGKQYWIPNDYIDET